MLEKIKSTIKEYWAWIAGAAALFFLAVATFLGVKKQDESPVKAKHAAKIEGIDNTIAIKEKEEETIRTAEEAATLAIKNIDDNKKNNIEEILSKNTSNELSKLLAKEYNIQHEDRKP